MKTDQWTGTRWRETCRMGRWLLVAVWLMAPVAFGKNNWYTARTVNGQTWPISAGTSTAEVERFQNMSKASMTNGLFDIVISLYNNPPGDDNGQTQGNPGSEAQDNYEYIIQYFADGVYETTEGCHAIRNVRIYRNGQRQDADVIWTAVENNPRANRMNSSGVAANIHMCDLFVNHHNAVLTNSMYLEGAGYTLTHEWGHYAYGLFDEYCRWSGSDWTNLPSIDKVKPSIMNYQWNGTNRNYRWLNYSIRWQGHGTNGVDDFVPYENRRRGAQHQLLGNSGWGTLRNDPVNDPTGTAYQRSFLQDWGIRIYYPELANVAPSGNNPPQINLSSADPLNTLPSRRSLNIIWMGSNNVANELASDLAIELVIDRSGSMGYSRKMSRAKTVAKMLMDQIPNGSAVGVVDYDTTVTVLYPVTLVTNVAIRQNIKSAIDTLSPRDYSAMGDAAQTALDELNAFGHSNMTKAVFLLSDGYSNEGIDPLEVCPAYANAQVPIMGFCLGIDWDNRLPLMAWATGGQCFSALTNLQSVVDAFRQSYAVAAGQHLLAQGNAAAAQGVKASGTINIPFTVDATLGDISVAVGYSLSNTVAVTLNSPNGTVYHASSTNDADSERVMLFAVTAPVAGVWSIIGAATIDGDLWYQAEAGASAFTYNLTASAAGQNVVSFPAPLEIVACLEKTRNINGAVVTAQVTATNDSTTVSLVLSNSSPGQYSAFYPATNGIYTVVVQADNSAGTAYLTSAGTTPSELEDEGDPLNSEPDEPIAENFSRIVTFQVTITNVPDGLSAPAAPDGVLASDGAYANEVEVAWNAVTNAQVYEIWRQTGDQSGTAVKLDEMDYTFTNYFDSSAANGVMYYYRVKANNIIGSSAFSGSDTGWRQAFPPVADYDGDGKTDPGIYNQSADEWRLKLSGSGYAFFVSTLSNLCAGDRPLAADFDGDRLADPATYQESSGDWKVMLSSSGYYLITVSAFLGGSGYAPVAADFDGDRLADPAVYQASTGNWQIRLSASGYALVSLEGFGDSGHLAVPADYDGDGRADPAVYQLSTGTWIVMMSGSGYSRLEVNNLLGGSGWIPAVGDYDGDAKADPAVRNETSNEWIVMFSSGGYAPVHLTLLFEF